MTVKDIIDKLERDLAKRRPLGFIYETTDIYIEALLKWIKSNKRDK